VGTPGDLKVIAASAPASETGTLLKNVSRGPLDFVGIRAVVFDNEVTADDLVACW